MGQEGTGGVRTGEQRGETEFKGFIFTRTYNSVRLFRSPSQPWPSSMMDGYQSQSGVEQFLREMSSESIWILHGLYVKYRSSFVLYVYITYLIQVTRLSLRISPVLQLHLLTLHDSYLWRSYPQPFEKDISWSVNQKNRNVWYIPEIMLSSDGSISFSSVSIIYSFIHMDTRLF